MKRVKNDERELEKYVSKLLKEEWKKWKDVLWEVRFELTSVCRIVARLNINFKMEQLDYVEFDNKNGDIVFAKGIKLTNKDIKEFKKYIQKKDYLPFKKINMGKYGEKHRIGYCDEVSKHFYASQGENRIDIDMHYVYDKKYNFPPQNLYSYIAKKYFSNNKYKSTYIGSGIFASVCPMF